MGLVYITTLLADFVKHSSVAIEQKINRFGFQLRIVSFIKWGRSFGVDWIVHRKHAFKVYNWQEFFYFKSKGFLIKLRERNWGRLRNVGFLQRIHTILYKTKRKWLSIYMNYWIPIKFQENNGIHYGGHMSKLQWKKSRKMWETPNRFESQQEQWISTWKGWPSHEFFLNESFWTTRHKNNRN